MPVKRFFTATKPPFSILQLLRKTRRQKLFSHLVCTKLRFLFTATQTRDKLTCVVRENNPTLDKTTTWCYDVSGNVCSRTEYAYTTGTVGTPVATFNYAYGNGWKDQLTAYNGQSITYDQAGNPTSYKGATLGWTRGRLLASYNSVSMQYDANGIRTRKVVPTTNGTKTTEYIYSGSNLFQEKVAINQTEMFCKYFLYNSQGVVGFVQNGTTYLFRKNFFGDVTAIYRGATKVAEYAYDAWGNCTIVSDTSGIGTANPFRYRSYLFDKDIGFYYVQGRYYDPQTGRFISPAKVSDLNPKAINGLNLYSFAGGNHISASYMYSADGSSRSDIVQVNSIIGSYIANQQFGNTSNSEHVLAWVVKGVDIALTSKSLLFSASTIHNNISYFKNNLKPFDADMKTLGTSMKNGVLAFNQFSWSMGSLDAIGLAISVGLDIYDSVQRGVSTGGVILGATLTAAKGIGLIYLNKGIINGATALGGIFGPGGAVVGFIVGVVASIVVDIFLDNWLDELIDNLAT